MKKCKFIGKDHWNNSWRLNQIYLYEKIENSENSLIKNPLIELYPFHIYTLNKDLVATYSENFFNEMFQDVKLDRLNKLKKLNEEIKDHKIKNTQ